MKQEAPSRARTARNAVLLVISLLGSTSAQAYDIDLFDDPQGPHTAAPTTWSEVSGGMIGHWRDLRAESLDGGGTVTTAVDGTNLLVTVPAGTQGEARVTWDCADGGDGIYTDGLMNEDLTWAGENAFQLNVTSASAGTLVIVEVFTRENLSSTRALVLPAVTAPASFVLPYSSFVARLGTGADFADVGAITLAARGDGVSLVLDSVEVLAIAGAVVTASKTASPASVNPSGTIDYEIAVQSQAAGVAAPTVSLGDTLDANTTLVAGSLEISPVAFDDVYVSTASPVVIPAATGVLANDKDYETPADTLTVSASSAATSRGGTVAVAPDGSFTYTAPAGLSGPDTFTYTVDDGNGITDSAVATVSITDAVPTVTSTTPAHNAANLATNINLTVTFSEPVDVTGDWFVILCGTSGARLPADTAVSGGPTTFTIDPNVDFSAGDSCAFLVDAFAVTDQDANDPPDSLDENLLINFDIEGAPDVNATEPYDGATGVAATADVVVHFTEAVDVTGSWFQIVCGTSGTRNVADTVVTGGPSSFTINPNTDFTPGESCTATITAAQVADEDSVDPPNQMLADYLITFTVEQAPFVVATTPVYGAVNVVVNQNVTVTFSEPVDVAGNWFRIICNVSGVRDVPDTVVTGGPTTFTIDPNVDFVVGEPCNMVFSAPDVADQDGSDPPDTMLAHHYLFFRTDEPPAVQATAPVHGAMDPATHTNVTITFTEDVAVTGNWFQIVCGTSGTRNPSNTVITGGPLAFMIDPDVDLAVGESCTATIFAAQVTDQDAGDPPDNMSADFTFSFSTDAAPSVAVTAPANGATNAALNADVVVTFNEAVNVAGDWFKIVCGTSGTRNPADTVVTGGPTAFTINPNVDFVPAETCTTTVFAAEVTDQDGNDPPENMATDHAFTFTIDAAPTVSSTTPTNGATGVSKSTNITIDFSESVSSTGTFFIQCPALTAVLPFTPSPASPSTTFTLDPTSDLPVGQTCSVTVPQTQITDADTADPPDQMVADYSFSFQVPPEVTDDVATATGNIAIRIQGTGVLANDVGAGLAVDRVGTTTADQTVPPAGSTTVATAQGGSVLMRSNGTYDYNPPPGRSSGTDTFKYRVSSAGGPSSDATVTITISDILWFVCKACAGANLGTVMDPFTSIASFTANNTGAADKPKDGEKIYVRTGAYSDTGDTLGLRPGQQVYGQGMAASSVITAAPNSVPNFTSLNAGARPSIAPPSGNGVNLSTNNRLEHVDVGPVTASAAKIAGSAFGTAIVRNSWLTGGGQALSLVNGTADMIFGRAESSSGPNNVAFANVAGSVDLGDTGGVFSGATGDSIVVTGGSVSVTHRAIVGEGGAGSAALVRVTNGHTGTLTFTGVLTATIGQGLQFDNADGTYTFNNRFDIANAAGGVSIVNGSAGSFSFTHPGNSVSNPSGTAFNVNGGSGNINYVGALNKSNPGRVIEIQNRTGGAITFAAAVTASTSSTGINISTNSGGSVTFQGGLTLNVNSTTPFNATSGGTVEVCDENPCDPAATGGLVNTISSTGQTALNVTNTTIGANRLEFRSLSTSGASNGIVLNNTGAVGGLSVKGTGSNDSGGTIASSGADGISLTDTRSVSLAEMKITSSGQSHIEVTNVNGLSLTNVDTDLSTAAGILGSNVTALTIAGGSFSRGGAGSVPCNVNGFHFTNLMGSSSIGGITVSQSNTIQFRVLNNTATTAAPGTPTDVLTVTNTTWNNHSGPCGGDHLSVGVDTGGNFKLVTNASSGKNTFTTGGTGVQAAASGSGTMTAFVTGVQTSLNTAGVVIGAGGAGNVNFDIYDNKTSNGTGFSQTGSLGLAVTCVTSGTCRGYIRNNTINHTAGTGTDAFHVLLEGNGTINASVTGNVVSGNFQRGFVSRSYSGTGVINLELDANTLTGTSNGAAGALQGILVEAGASGSGHANRMCLDMGQNNVTMVDTTAYRLRNEVTAGGCPACTFELKGFGGDGSNATDISNWITNAPNSNVFSTTGTPISIVINNPFTTASSCAAPGFPAN